MINYATIVYNGQVYRLAIGPDRTLRDIKVSVNRRAAAHHRTLRQTWMRVRLFGSTAAAVAERFHYTIRR